jgi:hypothetical protein
LLYQRLAATAAILFLLGGCSFFGFWDTPETPAEEAKIDRQGLGSPLEGRQLAALPGYQSDRDVVPSRVEANRGFVGNPARRPLRRLARAPAAIPVQPVERQPILEDLLPRRQILDLQPISAGFESVSLSLADLIADRDWRKRTSETLSRLFQ